MANRLMGVLAAGAMLLGVASGCASSSKSPSKGEPVAAATRPAASETVPPEKPGAFDTITELPKNIYDQFSGNTPLKYAKMMEDTASADNRRNGINWLSSHSFGRHPPY